MAVSFIDKSVVDKNKAHWILEDEDLDSVYCSKCGYAVNPDTNFKFSLNENNDIVVEYPNKCPKCGCEINNFHIIGRCFDIIKENLMKKV